MHAHRSRQPAAAAAILAHTPCMCLYTRCRVPPCPGPAPPGGRPRLRRTRGGGRFAVPAEGEQPTCHVPPFSSCSPWQAQRTPPRRPHPRPAATSLPQARRHPAKPRRPHGPKPAPIRPSRRPAQVCLRPAPHSPLRNLRARRLRPPFPARPEPSRLPAPTLQAGHPQQSPAARGSARRARQPPVPCRLAPFPSRGQSRRPRHRPCRCRPARPASRCPACSGAPWTGRTARTSAAWWTCWSTATASRVPR